MVNEFNEISYAAKMLDSGFITNRKMYELNILAKYYFWRGLKAKEVYSQIIDFCNKHFENFNEVLYFDKLQSILKNAAKIEINEIGTIPITDKDIEFIKCFNKDLPFQRVLFGLIVFKKIRIGLEQNPYLNCKYSKFSKYCKLNKTKDIYPIIKEMSDMGLLRVCRNSNIEILFPIDNSGKVVMRVHDFYNLGSYWAMCTGKGRYTHCEMCGKIIPVRGSWRKFCDDCVKEQHRLHSRKTMRKIRSCQVEESSREPENIGNSRV